MRRFLIILSIIMLWWQQDILVERSTSAPKVNDVLVQIQEYLPPSPLKKLLKTRDSILESLWENTWLPSSTELTAMQADNKPVKKLELESKKEVSLIISAQPSSSPVQPPVKPDSPASSASVFIPEHLGDEDQVSKEHILLVAGDSMASGVATSFRQLIQQSKKPYKFYDFTKHSTGLTNKSYYDWPTELENLIVSKKPDTIVFFVGANDAQGLKIDKSWYRVEDDAWGEEYASRIIQLCNSVKGTQLYWIGLPPMENPEYNQKIQRINALLSKTVSECGTFAHWIDISDLFGGEQYLGSSMIGNKNVKLRAGDGIHMTYPGYALISQRLWDLWYVKDIHD